MPSANLTRIARVMAQIVRLSIADQHRFAAPLLNPPPLAPAMKRAVLARKRLIRESS